MLLHSEIVASYKKQVHGIKAGSTYQRAKITADMCKAEKATLKLVGHEPASNWFRINPTIVKRVN